MIDPSSPSMAAVPSHYAPPKAVLKMVASDRMGGSVPAWVAPSSAQETAVARLSQVSDGRTFSDVMSEVLSYQEGESPLPANAGDKPFGFGDLVDIVNPLQHLPVIGTLYRNLTGDEIRPSSRVLGGVVFGGAVGAASSLVNVIIEEETGKDVTEHTVAFLMPEETDPDMPLEKLARSGKPSRIPDAALGFADSGHMPIQEPEKQVWKFNE